MENFEFILEDTDIFDLNIADELEDIILNIKNQLNKDKEYKVTVSFSVENLTDSRLDTIIFETKKHIKNDTDEDKIKNLLSYQLDVIDKKLSELDINYTNIRITGERMDLNNSIKITFEEKEIQESNSVSNKNRKSILKVREIMPNLEYTKKLAEENAIKIFKNRYNLK